MLLPALTIAIIALVQGAGVSQSTPNPDGEYPDPSGDFRGQGAANVSVGIFSGIPVGGSLGNTTMLKTIGGLSRWANIFTGIFAAVILLFFAPFIEILPLTTLAGLLIVVGFSMIKVGRIETLWANTHHGFCGHIYCHPVLRSPGGSRHWCCADIPAPNLQVSRKSSHRTHHSAT
jgi:SulP family sulfate permease